MMYGGLQIGRVVAPAADVEIEGIVRKIGDGTSALSSKRQSCTKNDLPQPRASHQFRRIDSEFASQHAGIAVE